MANNQPTNYSLYRPHNLHPAYQLRYGWTGWSSQGNFPVLPPPPFFDVLAGVWNNDGLRLLEKRWASNNVSLVFSALPTVSPVFLANRVKGRLQYALRTTGEPIQFSRKLAVRSIGRNTREIVEAYIQKQISRDRPADPRYEEMLKSQGINDPPVDLSQPEETRSGRYWYNLHLVLVVQGRYRAFRDAGAFAYCLAGQCGSIPAGDCSEFSELSGQFDGTVSVASHRRLDWRPRQMRMAGDLV